MNFVQFHIGDWDSSTRLLSPTEKGIYIDLLFLYYSLERPLMRSECERIARAYADSERQAMEYVLERFFMADGDSYRHIRCDQEIEATRAKSAKAAASAKARWDRQRANVAKRQKEHETMQKGCLDNANASETHVQSECGRTADAMLTDNRKPISNKPPVDPPLTSRAEEQGVEAEATDSSLFESEGESESEPAEKPKPERKPRQPLVYIPDKLPDEWRKAAKTIRPDVNPDFVFNKVRARFAGTSIKKTLGNWRKIFLDWIGREYARNGDQTNRNGGQSQGHSGPSWEPKPGIDYTRGINPDFTINKKECGLW